MVAGCFGLRVEGGWLTILRVEEVRGWLAGLKVEGGYIMSSKVQSLMEP